LAPLTVVRERRALTARDGAVRATIVLLAASLLQVAALYAVGRVPSHHEILGITGALAVLIAVAAAILAGPVVGGVVAGVGGAAFFAFVTDFGATAPVIATLGSAAVWSAVAVAAGVVASRLRRAQAERQAAEEEASRLHARLEAGLMPRIDVHTAGLQVHVRYRPGEHRLGIGGDFFDVTSHPRGGTAIVIGDVMGHGADAAALGATLRAGWRALTADAASPARLVASLRKVLEQERHDPDTYVTLCLAWLSGDNSSLEVVTLGHPAPLIRAGSRVEPLPVSRSLPLGVFEGERTTVARMALPPRWTLFFFTDGIVEGRAAPDATERYGVHRLAEFLARETSRSSAASALDRLLAATEAANGGALSDDATVLSLSPLHEARCRRTALSALSQCGISATETLFAGAAEGLPGAFALPSESCSHGRASRLSP
jgi:serine phosphatase RsbU (regulator of sigma subunit)